MPTASPDKHVVKKLAEVLPFRGLRYNQELIPDLTQVVAPPYDVINAAEQRHFHQKHTHNAIHLDFGLTEDGDDEQNNRYSRAAQSLNEWLEAKILQPERQPAIYFCREEYEEAGQPTVREGFIAAVKLAEFDEGIILPHEQTARKAKNDRFLLTEATEANLSPIYSLYSDPDNAVTGLLAPALAGAPQLDLTDEDGTRHSVWVIDDPALTAALTAALSEKVLLIADGHHRYETALAYRRARRQEAAAAPGQPYDYTMMYLSNMDNSGGTILPIHRFVFDLAPGSLEHLLQSLPELFEVELLAGDTAERQRQMMEQVSSHDGQRNAFGLYSRADDSYRVLVARGERPIFAPTDEALSDAYRSLDVAVLDRVILRRMLGIEADGANSAANVRFIERTDKALLQLDTSHCDLAFFLNATTMENIKTVAGAGEKMPQKSTYFHPKPLTGLVFRSFKY